MTSIPLSGPLRPPKLLIVSAPPDWTSTWQTFALPLTATTPSSITVTEDALVCSPANSLPPCDTTTPEIVPYWTLNDAPLSSVALVTEPRYTPSSPRPSTSPLTEPPNCISKLPFETVRLD